VDVAQLEHSIRDDLNPKVPRVMSVLEPLKVIIENYNGSEEIIAPYYPHDVPKEGSRKLPFSQEIYINRDDFSENPPKGYYRLTPNQPVRLRYAYIIKFKEVIKSSSGDIIEIRAEYYPNSKSGEDSSGIKVKSAIQWVEAKSAREVEVRLYDRLFQTESPQGVEDINPNSLKVIKNALIEPAVITEKPDIRFQFEREGYFYTDPIDYSDERPIFNKIVSLKDSWAKKSKKRDIKDGAKQKAKRVQIDGEVTPMTPEQQKLFDRYFKELKLNSEVANTLARDRTLSNFFHKALEGFKSPVTIANIVTNEVARELKHKRVDELKFTPKDISQLAKMVDEETISTKIAKQVYEDMAKSGQNPIDIVEERGLKQISDPNILLPIIDEVISKNPQNVEKYKNGNRKLFGFFVGQVLKATKGRGNPRVVNRLIKNLLE